MFSKKVLKFIFALLIASILLYISFSNSYQKTKTFTHTDNNYTFHYKYHPYGYLDSLMTISIAIDGVDTNNVKVILRQSKLGQDQNSDLRQFRTIKMKLEDYQNGFYNTSFNLALKGNAVFYYFEIQDKVGRRLASLMDDNGKPFRLLTIGHIPAMILYSKLFLMLISFFFIGLIGINSFKFKNKDYDRVSLTRYAFIAFICLIIGGVILSTISNNYTFGKSWEAFPFGNNTGDNKIQLILVFLLLLILINLKALLKGLNINYYYTDKFVKLLGIGLVFFTTLLIMIPDWLVYPEKSINIISYLFFGGTCLIILIGLFLPQKIKSKHIKNK